VARCYDAAMTARFVLAGALLALAAPAWAVNKDIERLQIQIAALQGQIADLQRTTEDNQREIKRLGETLAEQNAFLRKALQDRRTQDDALQTAIKEFGERMAELEERLQQPAAAPAPIVPVPDAGSTLPAPGAAPPAAAPPPPRELYSQAYADYARGNYDLAIQSTGSTCATIPTPIFPTTRSTGSASAITRRVATTRRRPRGTSCSATIRPATRSPMLDTRKR